MHTQSLQFFRTMIVMVLGFSLLAGTPAKYAKEAREVASMAELKTHLASKQPVVIMFYAPWCGACGAMREPFNRVCNLLNSEALFIRVNAENEKLKDALDQFGIEAVPTIVFKHLGVMDEDQLSTAIRTLLKKPTFKPSSNQAEMQKKASPAPKKAPQSAPKKSTPPTRKTGSLAVAQGQGDRSAKKKASAALRKPSSAQRNSHQA